MTRHVAPVAFKLADGDVERVRRAHHDAIRNLQTMPAAELVVIEDVALVDSIDTAIPHKLGRKPKLVVLGPPHAAAASTGRITEIRDSSHDPAAYLVLRAVGWGGTITISVGVL